MHPRTIAVTSALLCAGWAFACGTDPTSDGAVDGPLARSPSSPDSPPPPPGTTPPAVTPPGPAAPLAPRLFECDPTAVTGDTLLRDLPAVQSKLVLRPSGQACANHLVFVPGSGPEKVLSSSPGMIILADVTSADPASATAPRVACFSNEMHGPAPGSTDPMDRRPEGVALDCAVYTGSWSSTFRVVPPSPDYAAWLAAVRPGKTAADPILVRWLRDSTFQFLHTETAGRPDTDGVYETTLAADGTIGPTTRVPGDLFDAKVSFVKPGP